MRIICSWCKKVIGEKEPVNSNAVTHTICPTCAYLAELTETVKDNIKDIDIHSRFGLVEAYICLHHARIAGKIKAFYAGKHNGLYVREAQ